MLRFLSSAHQYVAPKPNSGLASVGPVASDTIPLFKAILAIPHDVQVRGSIALVQRVPCWLRHMPVKSFGGMAGTAARSRTPAPPSTVNSSGPAGEASPPPQTQL